MEYRDRPKHEEGRECEAAASCAGVGLKRTISQERNSSEKRESHPVVYKNKFLNRFVLLLHFDTFPGQCVPQGFQSGNDQRLKIPLATKRKTPSWKTTTGSGRLEGNPLHSREGPTEQGR